MNEEYYTRKYSFENFRLCKDLDTQGQYDIPIINPVELSEVPQFIGFNFARTEKRENIGLHFFCDDYQFKRIWEYPERYAQMCAKFPVVLSPDFSCFTDMPTILQIYSHFKKHLLGAWWQSQGINVVPTISWGDKSSFDWCFDGEPRNATVAVSSVGTQNSTNGKRNFIRGYEAMIETLNPEKILFYGTIPSECEGNIIPVEAFQSKFRRAGAE